MPVTRTIPRTPNWTSLALCLAGTLEAAQWNRSAAAEVWTWGPVLPQACSAFGCAAGDWGVITVGGTYWTPDSKGTPTKQWIRDVFLLAPGASRWERLPDYPIDVGQLLTVNTGERIYAIGGRDAQRPLADVYSIRAADFSAGWERGPALPDPSYGLGGGVRGETIYVVTDEVAMQPVDGPPLRPSAILALDVARNDAAWSEIAKTPDADIGYYAVALAGGNLYLFGGATQNQDGTLALTDAVRAFDLESRAWSQRRSLPYPLRNARATALNERIILIAGGVEDAADLTPTPDGKPRILLSNLCLLYDVQADEFTPLAPLRLAVADHGLATRDGLVLAVAGEDSPYRTRTDLVQSASVAQLLPLPTRGANGLRCQQSRTHARTAADNFQANGIVTGYSTLLQASPSFIKKGVQP